MELLTCVQKGGSNRQGQGTYPQQDPTCRPRSILASTSRRTAFIPGQFRCWRTSMTIAEKLVAEFDREMATTRRVLERVPSDKGPWKPHEKSFALGHLAQLVSGMPGWLTKIARGVDINLAGGPGYSFQRTEALLAQFDNHVREAREALAEFEDSDYALPWSLKTGDQVLFTDERGMVIRQTI